MRILDRRRVPDSATVRILALEDLGTWQSYQGRLASAESSFVRLIAAERS